jgi:hypothetical protein
MSILFSDILFLRRRAEELKIKKDEYIRKSDIIELERLVLIQKLQENKTK